MDIVKGQWEGMKNLPVSVAEYLFNLHEHMVHTTKLASERNDEAKKKYKMWYNQSTTECSFEGGEYVLVLMPEGSRKLEAVYHSQYVTLELVFPVT